MDDVEHLIADLVEFANLVNDVPSVDQLHADAADSHYIDLAVATNSRLVVSRDNDLLRLMDPSHPEARDFSHRFPKILVVRPQWLLAQLRRDDEPMS